MSMYVRLYWQKIGIILKLVNEVWRKFLFSQNYKYFIKREVCINKTSLTPSHLIEVTVENLPIQESEKTCIRILGISSIWLLSTICNFGTDIFWQVITQFFQKYHEIELSNWVWIVKSDALMWSIHMDDVTNTSASCNNMKTRKYDDDKQICVNDSTPFTVKILDNGVYWRR